MSQPTSPAKPGSQGRSPRQPTASSQFDVGDITRSNVAIGEGAMVIVNQALTAADQAQAQENYEGEKLARAVAGHARRLYDQVSTPAPSDRDPYKYLLPYELADAPRFFGRDALIDELINNLICPASRCRLAVLHGDAGMGKTSLLNAGIAPALVAAQHLPLQVRLTGGPVETSIKQALLPNLNLTPILRDAPLPDFLHQVADLLPPGKHVFVLLDQFELFFELPPETRQPFVEQLAGCLFAVQPRDHWLFSIRSSWVGHLSTFEAAIPQPLANTTVLPPLARSEGRAALLEPARLVDLVFEDGLLEAILADLGGDAIDPARLQLVVHSLVGGLSPDEAKITLAAYQEIGRAEGVGRDHLSLVLSRNLLPDDRDPAWLLLVAVSAQRQGVSLAELLSNMESYGYPEPLIHRLLASLESNHLVWLREARYQLTSPSLLAPINEWSQQRAALEQIRAEGRRQLQRIRNSALRGLIGGALGFCLAYLLAYWFQTVDRSLLPINTAYEAMPGAIAGLLLILSVDIAMASYHGPRRWLRWPVGALGGAIAFGQAFLFHTALNVVVDPLALLRATLEGVLWGAVAGLGTLWVMHARRPLWQSLPVVALVSGLVFWLLDSFGQAFRRPRIQVSDQDLTLWLILAGAVMPLFVIAAALLGRHPEETG